MAKFSAVEIEWLDSMQFGEHYWLPVEEVTDAATYEGMLHRTVGFVVHEDEDSIIVVSSYNVEGPNVGGVIQIPTTAVLSRRPLRH